MTTDNETPVDKKMSVRLTDTDRAHAVTALDAAFAHGALDVDEHDQRVTRAWAARHRDELAALTTDLPEPDMAEAARTQRESDLAAWLGEWRWWLGGALIMSTIWGTQSIRSEPRFFWPLVPLAIWAAILIAVAIWPREDDH